MDTCFFFPPTSLKTAVSLLTSSITLDKREILKKGLGEGTTNKQGVCVCVHVYVCVVSKQPLKLTFYAVMEARANAW